MMTPTYPGIGAAQKGRIGRAALKPQHRRTAVSWESASPGLPADFLTTLRKLALGACAASWSWRASQAKPERREFEGGRSSCSSCGSVSGGSREARFRST